MVHAIYEICLIVAYGYCLSPAYDHKFPTMEACRQAEVLVVALEQLKCPTCIIQNYECVPRKPHAPE